MNEPDPIAEDTEDIGPLLIARIVERAARPADYERFGALAQAAPGRWPELLAALRDDDALHLALDESLSPAERIELPVLPAAPSGPLRSLRPGTWSGWLAAAALALVWMSGSLGPGAPDEGRLDDAPLAAGSLTEAPAEAGPRPRDASPQGGDPVLGGLPLHFVAAQPAADGDGLELLYVQPVLRRTRIDGVLQVGTDEHGRPAPVPVDPAVLVRHESL